MGAFYDAVVANTATTGDDDVYVYIDEFDSGNHRFGPVAWAPRTGDDGSELPSEGDTGVAVETNNGRWWLLQWISN